MEKDEELRQLMKAVKTKSHQTEKASEKIREIERIYLEKGT